MTKYKYKWCPPGQRIIKTSTAVMLCLLVYMLLGYRGNQMPAEAAITAIICMQAYLHDTAENALGRLLGTLIGACWGFLFLLIMTLLPVLGKEPLVLYPLMGAGTLVALHSAVLLHREDTSALAAIVFICVVVAYPDIENPLGQAFHRILDVMLGTAAAFAVNAAHLPRTRVDGRVFFLPVGYLSADPYQKLQPAVQFRLHTLFRDGARICLISEHAPTVQTSQLNDMNITVPMIVMDGAAIYDPVRNVYLSTTSIDPASARWLMKRLDGMGAGYFIYTVHRDRNCIYHHGVMTEKEQTVYQHLSRSPYRYYLADDHFSASDTVYFKIVGKEEDLVRIRKVLEPFLEKMKLRSVIRPQAGLEGGCSLYFYAAYADVRHAKEHLMRLLRREDPRLEMRDVTANKPCLTMRETIRLLRKLKAEYEPVVLTPEKIRKNQNKSAEKYKINMSKNT